MEQNILSFASLKGGVGKTTDALFMAKAYAAAGMPTLLIDMDSNNNATDYLLRNTDSNLIESKNLYHILTGRVRAEDAIHPVEFNLSILPCTSALHRVGPELAASESAISRFSSMLRELPDYQRIILDLPPAICFELRAGLYASDIVLSPIQSARWAIQALELLKIEIEASNLASGNHSSLIAVPSIIREKEDMALRQIELIAPLSKTSIHYAPAIKRATAQGRRLQARKSWSEFVALAKEF